jgi:DNA-binding response OmpR family regulator
MDQILLYEPDKTRSRRFTFLLGMAGHKCSVTYTLNETLSWLHSEKLLRSHLRLLLLGAYPLDSELLSLCAELQSPGDIPILCLAKPGDIPDDRMIFCAPEKLIGCINDILTATEAENSQRSG